MTVSPNLPFTLIRAEGAPRARGRTYGECAAEQITRSIDFYSRFVVGSANAWEEMKEGLLARVDGWRDDDEESIVEIEGIAEGAGVEFGDILALNCRGAFTAVRTTPEEGCTSFAVMPWASSTAHQMTGQNWDYLAGIQDTIVLVLMVPERGPKQLLIVEAGQVGRHGYNEAGIALHANGLSGALRNPAGVPSPFWRRRILRQENISDALEAALHTPRPGTTNLLISDRAGFAIDLETTPSTSEALFPDEGWIVHTNHFLGPIPEPLRPTYNPGGESLVRLGRARNLMREAARDGGITISALQRMLRDHFGDGKSLCAHSDFSKPPADQWATVASVITDLTDGVMSITAGPPCESEYTELSFQSLFGG